MKSIKNKLSEIKSKIDEKVTVVAVSKTKPIDDILKLYEDGHFDFGENKVQELIVKNKELIKLVDKTTDKIIEVNINVI